MDKIGLSCGKFIESNYASERIWAVARDGKNIPISLVYKKEFKKFKNVAYAKSISRCLEKTDLVIIHTEWNDFKSLDFLKLIKNKKIKIYDMRNLYTPNKMTNRDIKYYSVGRG